jgi:L-lactate utilization protein LutC
MNDNQMKQAEREAFELWHKANYSNYDYRHLEYGYLHTRIQLYFDIWQARAKLTTSQVSEPVALCINPTYKQLGDAIAEHVWDMCQSYEPTKERIMAVVDSVIKNDQDYFDKAPTTPQEAISPAIAEGWKLTDDEVLAWNTRHDDKFNGNISEAKCAIEDARSMHLLASKRKCLEVVK